ncbi:triosephosphate isomerase [Wolffia australiana]
MASPCRVIVESGGRRRVRERERERGEEREMAGSSSTSLAAQLSCPRSLICPQYSGLRQVFLKQDQRSISDAHLGQIHRQLRVASSPGGKGCRAVVAMAGSGKFFVGGNWKCNGTKDSISTLVADLNAANIEPDVDVVVSPPFIYIDQVKNSLGGRIEISAQNCWVGKTGAYTGEISAEQLKDIGCQWVILGHSERRHIIKENDEFIGKKAAYALDQGIKVIACIGELLEERESGKTFDVCFRQLKAFADAVPSWENIVIAYEPVWAIGTGKVATPEQAQEVHAAVRDWLKNNVSTEVASSTRIIYGGSVNGSNCADLAKREDIDGFLVGGASLKGPEFAQIINSVTAKKVAA